MRFEHFVFKERLSVLTIYLVLIFLVIIAITPLLYILSISIMPREELFTSIWIPKHPTLQNYKGILTNKEYLSTFRNSWIIGSGSVLLTLLLALPAGYGLSRYKRARGRKILVIFVVLVQILPPILLSLSYFKLVKFFNLYNTHGVLIILDTSYVLPFSILLMKNFLDTIPLELEEAARVDGCTKLGGFLRVVIPLSSSGIIAISVWSFLMTWNEFLYAFTFTADWRARPISVQVAILMGHYVINWGGVMSLAIISSVPILLLYVFLSGHFIRAASATGAIKG